MSEPEPHARYIAAVAAALTGAGIDVADHAASDDDQEVREGSITLVDGIPGGITRWALKWYATDGWDALAELGGGEWIQFRTALKSAEVRYEVGAYLPALDIVAEPAEVVGAVQRIIRHAHGHDEDVDARLAAYAR